MCIMCIEIFKNRMTVSEARRALVELIEFESDSEKLAHFERLANLGDDELINYANVTAEEMGE